MDTGIAFNVDATVDYAKDAVISKTLIDKGIGNITLFSFDAGQGLSEHTAPFDAVVHIVDGEAEITIDGNPTIVKNGEMIIIQYSNASLCNRMMTPDVKEIVVKILSDFYKKDLNYVALPSAVWEQKSQEFIKKWKADRDGYITLSDIDHPALKEIPKFTKEVSEFTPDSVKDAISIFGSDAVRVKKGD
mgnify:CR=1 FL=1